MIEDHLYFHHPHCRHTLLAGYANKIRLAPISLLKMRRCNIPVHRPWPRISAPPLYPCHCLQSPTTCKTCSLAHHLSSATSSPWTSSTDKTCISSLLSPRRCTSASSAKASSTFSKVASSALSSTNPRPARPPLLTQQCKGLAAALSQSLHPILQRKRVKRSKIPSAL